MDKLEDIYTAQQLLCKNEIIKFTIQLETTDFDAISDKSVILKYVNMITNYLKECETMNLEEEIVKELKKHKRNIISYLNNRTCKDLESI